MMRTAAVAGTFGEVADQGTQGGPSGTLHHCWHTGLDIYMRQQMQKWREQSGRMLNKDPMGNLLDSSTSAGTH